MCEAKPRALLTPDHFRLLPPSSFQEEDSDSGRQVPTGHGQSTPGADTNEKKSRQLQVRTRATPIAEAAIKRAEQAAKYKQQSLSRHKCDANGIGQCVKEVIISTGRAVKTLTKREVVAIDELSRELLTAVSECKNYQAKSEPDLPTGGLGCWRMTEEKDLNDLDAVPASCNTRHFLNIPHSTGSEHIHTRSLEQVNFSTTSYLGGTTQSSAIVCNSSTEGSILGQMSSQEGNEGNSAHQYCNVPDHKTNSTISDATLAQLLQGDEYSRAAYYNTTPPQEVGGATGSACGHSSGPEPSSDYELARTMQEESDAEMARRMHEGNGGSSGPPGKIIVLIHSIT